MADVELDTPEVRMDDDDRQRTPAAESEARAPSPPPPEEEPAKPAKPAVRPKLDLSAKPAGRRGGGRSMFGVLLGTLNKAKIEDKERSASEAAKKRALIDQRLQHKLSKETSAVRKAEEARRGRHLAARKEDELTLKDSIIRARMHRLPTLANFLLTSDAVPLSVDTDENMEQEEEPTTRKPASTAARAILDGPPRGHPPPLFFLPAILLDNQKAFIEKRKKEVEKYLRTEWKLWCAERTKATDEIAELRAKAAEVDKEKREAREAQEKEKEKEKEKEEAEKEKEKAGEDVPMATEQPKAADVEEAATEEAKEESRAAEEDVKMDDTEPPGKDGDEKVEY